MGNSLFFQLLANARRETTEAIQKLQEMERFYPKWTEYERIYRGIWRQGEEFVYEQVF